MITNQWLLWAIIVGCSGLSVWLANNTKWGKFLGFVNMGLIMGFVLSNLGIAPIKNSAYNIVNAYFVPIGIVLMLFKCNLRKLSKCGPKITIAMFLSTICIFTSCILGAIIFPMGDETSKMAGVAIGDFVGNMQTAGGVGASLGISDTAMGFFTAATAIPWFTYSLLSYMVDKTPIPKFLGSYKDIETGMRLSKEEQEIALASLGQKEVSINISEAAVVIGAAVAVTGVGNWLGQITHFYSIIFYATIGVVLANFTSIHKFIVNEHLSTLCFAMFMFKTGCGAHVSKLAIVPLNLFLYLIFIYVVSSILLILISKITRIPWEYSLLAHMACIGGPVSTPPLAKVYKWTELVLPGIIIAVLGQVLGSYLGVAGAVLLSKMGI